ncbi:L,D-transpeptidase family protein [Actinomadura fibrosa]
MRTVPTADPQEIQRLVKNDNSGLKFKQQKLVDSFYAGRSYKAVWDDAEIRNSFLNELKKAPEEGLNYQWYQGEELDKILEGETKIDAGAAAKLDLLLTDAFLNYAHDLYYGHLDPRKLNESWGIERAENDLFETLNKVVNKEEPAQVLNDLKPKHQIYSDLKRSLLEYSKKEESGTSVQISKGDLIRKGEYDPRIPAVASRLKDLGYTLPKNTPDSLYSDSLQEVVKSFQKERGLLTDGIIGNSTIEELNLGPAERYGQILANLERWRWYPRDLGEHYVVINIPNFKLAVVKKGDTIRQHSVIAGSRARPTPIFSDITEYIVLNPKWHIPPTIKTQDVIPRASRDGNYLASHNMSVFNSAGEKLDPAFIDWSSPQVRSYSFVQSAGPSNPLGRLKIIYPNRFLVYLHDTPGQALFEQNQRAESSGCVRVENAVDLAAYILKDQEDWDEEKIQEVINSGKTMQVKIDRPLRVHHLYWTAWRAGNKTVFTNDVYDLDKKIYDQLLKN